MLVVRTLRRTSWILIVAVFVVAGGNVVLAQGTEDVSALNSQVVELFKAGKYPEAIKIAKRLLDITDKKFGPDHPNVATALNNLALIYQSQGQYAEAEPLYKRSLTIDERALGADHPSVAIALNNLAALYKSQGRYTEAEPLLKRSLSICEKVLGPDHSDVATAVNNLALLYQEQGRYAEAEPLYKRSLAIKEKVLGPDHPEVATALNNLALLYQTQGRAIEAEPVFKRALAVREKALGPDHPDVATAVNNLALLFQGQGRYAEAEPLFKRALAVGEKALGPDHPDVGQTLNNLALLYQEEGRNAEAEPLLKRALAVREKALGPDHPDVGQSLNNLALVYQAQGRNAEAEQLYKRALAVREKALGPDHPDVGQSLNNLALLYQIQGRTAEAEPFLKSALDVREKALGPDHLDVAQSLNNLAWLRFEQSNWTSAADFWRQATSVIERRALRGMTDPPSLTGEAKSEAERSNWYFWGLIKASHRLAAEGNPERIELAQQMFETAQWAKNSEAAQSLAQMAARTAKGDGALARLVRERQDLVGEWQAKDKQIIAVESKTSDKRDPNAEKAVEQRLAAIDARVKEIDARLAKDFPDYAALASPAPFSLNSAQDVLRDSEALVVFLDTPEWKPTPEETFVWVITKSDNRWVRIDLGTPSLQREVAALRCGLDYDGSWRPAGSRCAELLKVSYSRADHANGKPLPFDVARANRLYAALFGQVEDLIKDKSLLIVPSGALTQLPFPVLVTAPPDATVSGTKAFQQAAWLIRSHPLTVLPSVSSLKALRQLASDSHASHVLIGFGNPLLSGPDERYAGLAEAAREKQSCPKSSKQQIASLADESRGISTLSLRGGIADVAQIRSQVPLPETADELCAVARDLGADIDAIHLGANATETEIKRLSASGELANYRVIHFATHGALAGQLNGNSEPGLLLTPPVAATVVDDGYLSASDISGLKLDADWVILSACNTAAGDAKGAEALSGLARAFFYAGARALLVSHWSVDSNATVKLITGAMSRMAANKHVGRAEAMRQSMLALIDSRASYEAHPFYWAPFVVVGEGAASASR